MQYVERIRAVQPHDPYHLCGYCIGDQIVLEMAYLLEQAGEKVENIFLIAASVNDISNLTYPCIDDAITRDDFELDMTVFRQKVIALMNLIDIARAVPDYDSADAKKILYFVNLIRSLIYGGRAYTDMRIIHAPLYLFSPDHDPMLEDNEQNATLWQGHTTEKLTNYLYDGDHFNMFESENNDDFCEKFEIKYKNN